LTKIELFYIKVGNAKMPIDEKDKKIKLEQKQYKNLEIQKWQAQ
jgi:hypothetical protein